MIRKWPLHLPFRAIPGWKSKMEANVSIFVHLPRLSPKRTGKGHLHTTVRLPAEFTYYTMAATQKHAVAFYYLTILTLLMGDSQWIQFPQEVCGNPHLARNAIDI